MPVGVRSRRTWEHIPRWPRLDVGERLAHGERLRCATYRMGNVARVTSSGARASMRKDGATPIAPPTALSGSDEMFERFTDRARRVVVLAQEEARMLNHNYIGTEHILLGLIHEGEGVAA